jgi:cytosine/adenosine deaminase-related metal-dependent hydrolase
MIPVAACLAAACSAETPIAALPDGGDAGGDSQAPADAAKSDSSKPPNTTGFTSAPAPAVEKCTTTLAKASSGVCDVTKAGTAGVVIRGKVVTPEKIYEGGEVVVDSKGIIQCAACDCSADANYAAATTITCADGVVTPALINTHDHVTFAQLSPKPHTARYDHRHEWRKGAGASKPKISTSAGTGNNSVPLAELRFVLSGTASTVGSGGAKGMLRNLDQASNSEGLTGQAVEYETFPLGDSDGKMLTDCTYKPSVTTEQAASEEAFAPHVAEGIGDAARNEFVCASGQPGSQVDYMKPQTAMIHAIGLLPADAALAGSKGVGVIWSPRSNIDLYGFTASVSTFARLGVQISLGTDWSASGSMNMLRELSCADDYNRNNLGGFFADYQLYRMVTEDAAANTAKATQIGSIKKGLFGDITVWNGAGKDTWRAIIGAGVSDVAVVLRAGKVLTGETEIVDALSGGQGCEALTDCLAEHKICSQQEFGKSVADIFTAAGGDKYPVFFCGTPDTEPSCVPSRPNEFTGVASSTDTDGDGIANDSDKCPTMFDAPRLIDKGQQGDADGDGVGDACDPCPLKPNATECAPVSGDLDSDTIPDDKDNCPTTANTDQADADKDGKGDVCDACPADSNPGSTPCPAKKDTVAQARAEAKGTAVTIENVCVTVRRDKVDQYGIWIQDPSHTSTTASGGALAYLAKTVPTVVVGDLVTVTATTSEYSGGFQLEGVSITKTGTCPKTIDSMIVTVSPADIATGGSLANAYNGMIVKILNVAVTNANPDAPSDFDEFAVTGNLRVDDYAYDALDNTYTVGATFQSITGVVSFGFANSKLCPRSAADIVP